MRRNWFRNRLGRKNSKAFRGKQHFKPRSFCALEPLEPRRLLAVLSVNGELLFPGQDHTLLLHMDSIIPGQLDAILDGFTVYAGPLPSQVNYTGGPANDSLVIDSTWGLVSPVGGIHYDGLGGFDSLQLSQTGGPSITSSALIVGATPGSGVSITNAVAFNTQTVFYQNIEPINDFLPSPDFAIAPGLGASLLNASNAINYSSGSGLGIITIDNSEPIYFTNKTHLHINAGAGDDTINLNPGTPNGLQDIEIIGGDPTASDKLIVNGTDGQDTINYSPSAAIGGGTVKVNSDPTINFTTTESLVIDGQDGNDRLTYTSPVNSGLGSVLTFIPGNAGDSATVSGRRFAGPDLVPMTYQNVGISATLTFATADTGPFDYLDFFGTAAPDQFDLNPSSGGTINVSRVDQPNISTTIEIHAGSVSTLALHGLEGDDLFNLSGPLFYSRLVIDGGGPSASDVVNLTFPSTNIVVNLGNDSLGLSTSITGYGGLIILTGIEGANINADEENVTINGTAQPDNITYTPTDIANGTLTSSLVSTTFNLIDVASTTASSGFLIDPAGASDVVTVNGTAGGDSITITRNGANTVVKVNGLLIANIVSANTESLRINGQDGDDSLTVDASGGPILIPIVYDGGTGRDSLSLTGGTAVTDTYTPGPIPGSGNSTIVFTGPSVGVQVVNFLNLEPVYDDVAAATLTINGTDANNAINYTSGGFNDHGGGLVTVDDQEGYYFANKTHLVINAGAGDDVINLNNPGTPPGLMDITVNGGDPTASDTLIVNGTSGTDTINYTPSTTIGSGSVQVNALPTVNFTTIEQLKIDGQGGGDALTVTTPAGFDTDIYTPGATADSGNITVNGAAGNTRVPLAFSHLGNTGSVTFANAGGSADTLIVNGTANSDRFTVTGATNSILITDLSTFNAITPTIKGPGVGILELNGLTGDDLFVVSGALPWALLVDGGDPTGSDTLNLSGATGAVGVALADITTASLTTITGYGAAVVLTGIEIANVNAGGNTVTTTGTTHSDSITVTPTASNAASLTDAELTTVFHFSSVSTALGGFTVNGNGGSDQLFVVGTQSADTIDVNDVASGANAVKVNSLLVVNYNSSMPHIEVDALAGSDTINIAPSTTTTFTVDGGDPIGVLPGDVLNLQHPVAIYQIFPGPTVDSGGLNTVGFQTISWIHIETVTNTGGTPIIAATNGDDVITIIARDSSTHAGTDGIQDFTVSINDGPEMLFINTPNLLVDALAGNDQIHVREPAPNNAVWNTQIWIAGGTPAANTGNVGDQIILETPGTQNVTYAPDVAAPALGGVVFGAPSATGSAQFNDTTNTSKITAVTSFSIAGFYQSSPGGVENFVYQGYAGNDSLTYLSPANSNNGSFINFTPGATQDSGTITAQLSGGGTLVPLTIQGLGSSGTVTFNGTDAGRHDVLTVNGTAAGEVFVANGPAGTVHEENYTLGNSTTPSLVTTSIQTLKLLGLGGADRFDVIGGLPYSTTEIQGSDPIANLSGATGPVAVTVGNNALSSITTVQGYGGSVYLIGIDTANFNANGNTVSVTGTSQPDAFVVTPTGAQSATLTDSGINTEFNFANVSGAVGGFVLNPLGGSDTVTVNGTSSADSQTVLVNGANTTVRTNALLAVDMVTANTESLVIASGNGDDQLTVNAINGPVLIPMVYDGGTGRDVLLLTGGAASTDTYTPGPIPGSGRSQIVFTSGGGGTQTVDFLNLEPVQDDVVATTATVNADNAANAINYSQGAGFNDHVLTGLVTVDNQETYEFTNKMHLVINALNGSDEINLNNPTTPAALVDITVNGGDPAASDVLIVNGTSGTDNINYSPSLTIGSGTVQVNALPTVIFTTVEQLKIDGQGGNDALKVTTPAGTDTITYNSGPPGSGPDTGSIGVNGSNGNTLVPLSFSHLGNNGSVTTANTGGGPPFDILIVNGTPNSDAFTVLGPSNSIQLSDLSFNNIISVPIHPTGVGIVELNGQNGDDAFNFTGGLPWSVLVDGGDPSASDSVNLTGATGAVTVTMANPAAGTPPTSIQGYNTGPGAVVVTGVEIVNMNTGGNSLTVNGNQSPNAFTYTPTGAAAGTFTEANINTVFNFTNTTAAFTINGSVGSFADQVTLVGTASRDLFMIDEGARTASVTNVANVVLKAVVLGANIQVLNAQGLAGQDTFLVTPAAGTQFAQSLVNPVGNVNNLLVNVDGGASSSGENNALVIATQAGGALPNTQFVVVNRGALANSGTVRTYNSAVQWPDINYVNVQTVSPFVGTDAIAGPFFGQPNLLILGPDLYEPNQNPINGSPFNAAFLGSGSTINVQNVSIFPNNTEFPFVPADQDYYRVVAQNTGTLDFQVYFNLFDAALFPQGGNLNIQVLDVNGTVIATGVPAVFGSIGATANARIRIPVVQGQTYYLRVFGASVGGAQNPAVVNGYNFTIVNTALVAPGFIDLSSAVPNGEDNAPLTTQGQPDTGQLPSNAPPSDSGRSQFDNVTNGGFNTTAAAAAAAAAGTSGTLPAPAGSTLAKPTLYIWVDDSFLLNDIPGNPTSGGVPGTTAIPINFNSSTTLVPTGLGNFRVAVYDGGGGAMTQTPGTNVNPSTNHTLDPNDGTFIGWAQPVPGVPHLYVLTVGSQGGATSNNASDTLSDGTHNITARLQIIEPSTSTNPIRTAFGPRSNSLQIIIDTVAPPVQFGFGPLGGGAITPGSDSGVATEPETSTDLVTNVTAPTFQGLAEADAIIHLYVAITNPANPNFSPNPVFPQNFVSIGETVAIPLDGTNAFPNGQWQLTSTVDLNDPVFFLRDGIRTIVVTAEDLAGNKSPTTPFGPGTIIQIEIDTQGPQITDVRISDPTIVTADGENLNYNLFGLKPDNAPQGPTPLVYAITINVQDLPARFAPFLNEIAFKPELVEGNNHADGGITLIGDANGRIAFKVFVNLVTPTPPGQPATGTIQLRFTDANGVPIALPDDRYTLFIDDEIIRDPAGNKLDGESNAQQPVNNPQFPTGNGLPGGDFTARFTIDSRPELGDFAAARVYVDINGNSIYDPQNLDFVNRDLTFTMQLDPTLLNRAQLGVHDSVFAGNFAGARGTADGFSKLGLYGTDPTGIGFRWLLDTDDNGTADTLILQSFGFTMFDQNGAAVKFNGTGIAFAGNFDGIAANGDEIGLFDGTHFFLDTNHSFSIDAGDTVITSALRGFPIVGDFNGDGTIDLATWQTDVFQFNFGIGGTGGNSGIPAMYSGAKDATINWGFPGVGEIPLAADMDQDGITDIGLWVPGHSGTVSQDAAETFFLISHNFDPVTGQPMHTGLVDPTAAFNTLVHAFTPTPLGVDIYSNFLDEFATPIVGNFDPPLAPASAAAAADTTAPTSSVSALAATQTSASFTVAWSGSDNTGGSGIASYDVYVSDNAGNFTRWLNHTANTSATYSGVNGHTYSFMSVATDNGGNVQATPTAAQATTKVQVSSSTTTTTTLTATSASITAGQSVTFTARVTGSGTPTGSVTFKDGTATLTTVALVSGAATYTNSSFAAGTHNITATYNPVAPNLGSVSTTFVETVTTASTSTTTTTTLTATSASITAGQSVTFTARVTGSGTPTGSVTFKDGTATLTTVALVSGAATYTNSSFAAGTHNITATYNPVAPNLGSVSTTFVETVTTASAPPPPPTGSQTFNGTTGNDIFTITPANATGSVTVTISNAGTKNVAKSLGTFAPTGALIINGLGGNDTLKLATATIGGKLITITAPISFSGGDGVDTLIGANQANIWNITGLNSGTLNDNAFDGVENLSGGTATDAFRMNTGGTLTGKINGGTGANTLDYTAYSAASVVNLQTAAATGAAGFLSITSLVGGSTTSLVGPNKALAWSITGANAGTVNGVSFTGVSNLTGGSLADAFTLANGASISGKIDGGAGIDTLKYAYATPVTVNLFSNTATGVAAIANFEGMVGGTSTADTLIGPNSANTWTVSTANAGKVNTFTFSGVENLTGGALNDNFVIGKSVGVGGHIDGGDGINMLDYAAYTTAVTVNLAAGTATNIGRGVNNIRVVRGGSAADNITGDDGDDALIGGAGNDILTAGSGHNLLFGGLGADTLNGGSGENILFSGTTKFDTIVATIDNLLAYWARTDLDYTTRVAALKAGSVAAVPALNATNVVNDTAVNTLNGGSGLDWFFAKLGSPKDTINNQITGEQVN